MSQILINYLNKSHIVTFPKQNLEVSYFNLECSSIFAWAKFWHGVVRDPSRWPRVAAHLKKRSTQSDNPLSPLFMWVGLPRCCCCCCCCCRCWLIVNQESFSPGNNCLMSGLVKLTSAHKTTCLKNLNEKLRLWSRQEKMLPTNYQLHRFPELTLFCTLDSDS